MMKVLCHKKENKQIHYITQKTKNSQQQRHKVMKQGAYEKKYAHIFA